MQSKNGAMQSKNGMGQCLRRGTGPRGAAGGG